MTESPINIIVLPSFYINMTNHLKLIVNIVKFNRPQYFETIIDVLKNMYTYRQRE